MVQKYIFCNTVMGVDPGTSLGIPDEADNGNPGTGWDYCFFTNSNTVNE